jgi:hypothetical protein
MSLALHLELGTQPQDVVRYFIQECNSPAYESALYAGLLHGHIETCRELLNEGAPYEELSQQHNLSKYPTHSRDFLATYASSLDTSEPTTNAVGKGDAHDEREKAYRIIKIDWYTKPLHGIAKKLGGLHSILVLTLLTGETRKEIIMEKALSSPRFENGIILSSCNMSELKRKFPELKLHVDKISRQGVLEDATLRSAYKKAVGLGAYHLSKSNCHHMALKVLNSCVEEGCQLKESAMPNYHLVTIAKGLLAVGLDLGGTGGGFGSASAGGLKSDIGAQSGGFRSDFDTIHGLGMEMKLDVNTSGSSLPQHSYTCAQLCEWIYEPDREAPEQLLRVHLHELTTKEPVQWALLSSKGATGLRTFFVVFKGTSNASDALIDAKVESRDDGMAHQLRVHNGMITSLNATGGNRGRDVLTVLTEELSKAGCQANSELLICGHSLGGGYSLLIALDLIDRQEFVPSAVITFGAPQVVIPPENEDAPGAAVWQKLNSICSNFVHSFDPVPRAAGEHCETWLEVFLQAGRHKQTSITGSVYLDTDVIAKSTFLGVNVYHAREYRTVGQVCFISAEAATNEPPGLMACRSSIKDPSIAQFEETPSRAGSTIANLLDFHILRPVGRMGYIDVVKKLTAQTHDSSDFQTETNASKGRAMLIHATRGT